MNAGSNNEINDNKVEVDCIENPILISSAEIFRDLINEHPQCHFELTSDIAFSGIHLESERGQEETVIKLTKGTPLMQEVGEVINQLVQLTIVIVLLASFLPVKRVSSLKLIDAMKNK